MAHLTPAELCKYNWRVAVFLKKYGNEQPFEFETGPKKVLVYSHQVAKLIQNKKVDQLQGEIFLGKNKKLYSISDLKLTPEFMETKGFGLEAKEIKGTNVQLEDVKVALASATVPFKIGSNTYDISSLQKTQGLMKSDFHFVTNKNEPVVWISHKDGRTAADFQQWGGITEPGIKEHREVDLFIDSVKAMFPSGIDKGVTVAREIDDKRLKMMSVYGNKYGGPFNEQNVTAVVQGPIDINKKGNYYHLCSNHVHLNGEDITGDFTPVLMAIYKGDRDQAGIKGARLTIQPRASRKVNMWL